MCIRNIYNYYLSFTLYIEISLLIFVSRIFDTEYYFVKFLRYLLAYTFKYIFKRMNIYAISMHTFCANTA